MKLRNKLAAVLATAMVMTSVPVVTMAASTNSMTRESVITGEKATFADATTAPALRIEFKTRDLSTLSSTNKEVFYVTVDNAKWLSDAKTLLETAYGNDAAITFTRESDSTVKVEVTGQPAATLAQADTNVLYVPILAELKEGEAKISIETKASGSSVSEGTWVFANTSDDVATVKAGTATSFKKEGKIAELTITEAYKDSMKNTSGNYYALVELDDVDFQFDTDYMTVVPGTYYVATKDTSGEVTSFGTTASGSAYTQYTVAADYSYGFSNLADTTITVYLAKDKTSMYVQLPNLGGADSQGVIKLKNLYVEANVKTPEAGELTLDVSGHAKEVSNLVVANIGEYGVVVAPVDKAVDIVAGQEKDVEFSIKEAIDATLTSGREMEISLENGYFVDAVINNDDEVDEDASVAELITVIKSIERKEKSSSKYTVAELAAAITDVVIKDEKVVGFTFEPKETVSGAIVDETYVTDKLDSFIFKATVRAGLDQAGEVKVNVESRDIDGVASSVVANVKEAVTVTTEAAVLKTGLKDQVAGKITIKEADKAILTKGESLIVYLEDGMSGIDLSTDKAEKPEVKVTAGDLQLGDVKVTTAMNKDNTTVAALVIEVKRGSKEASTIEIANFHFDTNRAAAEGSYDVQIGGKALSALTQKVEKTTAGTYDKVLSQVITVKDFIVNATPNTQDLTASNGLAKGTATFEIGKATYKAIDGTEKTMDAQSFIQDPGFTMIPVRYVAEAFGVSPKDIVFSKGTVTLFAGSRTIQLTSGSDIAVVNGAQVKMGTKVVIKEGRTYAPVGEVATILGIAKNWDASTKVATFENK